MTSRTPSPATGTGGSADERRPGRLVAGPVLVGRKHRVGHAGELANRSVPVATKDQPGEVVVVAIDLPTQVARRRVPLERLFEDLKSQSHVIPADVDRRLRLRRLSCAHR